MFGMFSLSQSLFLARMVVVRLEIHEITSTRQIIIYLPCIFIPKFLWPYIYCCSWLICIARLPWHLRSTDGSRVMSFFCIFFAETKLETPTGILVFMYEYICILVFVRFILRGSNPAREDWVGGEVPQGLPCWKQNSTDRLQFYIHTHRTHPYMAQHAPHTQDSGWVAFKTNRQAARGIKKHFIYGCQCCAGSCRPIKSFFACYTRAYEKVVVHKMGNTRILIS